MVNTIAPASGNRHIWLLVIVASLGYFVDLYDLVLFNVVKKESLVYLGLANTIADYEANEIFLFSCQMAGMMFGGIVWGILGDKRGRLSVLFGSILLYSMGNIVNAFIGYGQMELYALIRFITGVGLAGELGAGITLVVESMEKRYRGYGTMIIVTFGALGAVIAAIVGKTGGMMAAWMNETFGTHLVSWQMAYLIGGGLGLMLLLLRVGTMESAMFHRAAGETAARGNFIAIFRNRETALRYLACVLIGLPIWYIIGVLVSLCVGLSKELGIEVIAQPDGSSKGIETGTAVMYAYIGLSFGDLLSGLFSQFFRNRKRVVAGYLVASIILTGFFLFPVDTSQPWFYFMCFALGTATGYWALFVTIASEQFGTNIRSTVTNTVPNFVRGAVVLITGAYGWLFAHIGGETPKLWAAIIVGAACFVLAAIGTLYIRDTFHKDLDYVEMM